MLPALWALLAPDSVARVRDGFARQVEFNFKKSRCRRPGRRAAAQGWRAERRSWPRACRQPCPRCRSARLGAAATAHVPPTALRQLDTARWQTMVMDQIMPAKEVGCWKPGRDLVQAMLRWVCETFAFETVSRGECAHAFGRHLCAGTDTDRSSCKQAYDLLQGFPRYCGYRHNTSIQQRTCEKLLVELFPDRMDFTHKRRLHMSYQGENKVTEEGWVGGRKASCDCGHSRLS